MKAAIASTFLLLSACGGHVLPEQELQHVAFASLLFDMPADWQHTDDTTRNDVKTTTWAPDAKENDRKETVMIVRSERTPAIEKVSAGTLEHMLSAAQMSLPNVQASHATSSTNGAGLTWARIDVDFVPPGCTEPYHRVHAILVVHGSLVNVLYTARSPDAGLGVLTMVLASIRHGEA